MDFNEAVSGAFSDAERTLGQDRYQAEVRAVQQHAEASSRYAEARATFWLLAGLSLLLATVTACACAVRWIFW